VDLCARHLTGRRKTGFGRGPYLFLAATASEKVGASAANWAKFVTLEIQKRDVLRGTARPLLEGETTGDDEKRSEEVTPDAQDETQAAASATTVG
jgi:hypothetical protein